MPSSSIEEIKSRLDIADVVGSVVQLRKSGRSLKGLCPFHAEKTPSFYVFPESGTWHCFGCGEGGDVFSFLMKRENLEFGEALRELAGRAGVTLARPTETAAARDEHERLFQVLEASALYYQSLLVSEVGRVAREYLARRQVSEESQRLFAIGFASESSVALQRFLAEKGFSVEDMLAAGVVGRGERGDIYDLLRGRVVFPIRDGEGRAIALAGRAMADAVQPKYLNTPQTVLFDKGASLYALDLAREGIRQHGQAVIVEGYLDAIAAHQHGFKNVVATMGTAVTEQHLSLLKRGTSEILLALDADRAGQAAALRALEVANRALGLDVIPVPTRQGRVSYQRHPAARRQMKVIALDAGKDPDDVIHEDPQRWHSLVASAKPVVDFVLELLQERYDLRSDEGVRAAADEALQAISLLPDPIDRSRYVQRLSARLRVDEAALAERLRRVGQTQRIASAASSKASAPGSAAGERRQGEPLEEYVLALMGTVGLPQTVTLQALDFRHPASRTLFELFQDEVGGVEADRLGKQLPSELDATWMAVKQHVARTSDTPPDLARAELEKAALELRHRRLLADHEHVRTLLEDDAEIDAESRRRWLGRLRDLSMDLEAVHRQKQQLGRVGSMVSGLRRATEVLGG
jgi:DNA primase